MQKINKTLLCKKEDFYNELNMKGITDADYTQTRRVLKIKKIKNLSEYCDLYVQSNKLLPGFVFDNFQNMCPKIYELNPAVFLLHQDQHGKQL